MGGQQHVERTHTCHRDGCQLPQNVSEKTVCPTIAIISLNIFDSKAIVPNPKQVAIRAKVP